MRGGQGDISLLHYVQSDKIPNGRLMAKVEIPVNGSIGNHEHKNETEYYIILSGNGEVIEDGNISQVNAGDVVVTNNATHGIKNIGEGIYWNVPTFFFTGKMKPFDSKEYKRFIVNFNFYKQDTLRIIFLRGADATDPTGLLEGDYKDGRRVSSFKSIEELKKKEKELKIIIKQLLALMDK
ncbi:MAG: hypothetical protein A2W88_13895 [Bacteroidetes bacterium GWF2_40_13]|nr:MAG: hypothetical protein A2W88_13895 [Bacteroidetes bacterium GWF2_40_13]